MAEQDMGKIAADIAKKTAEMATTAATQGTDAMGKIAADIGKNAVGTAAKAVNEAGQGMSK